MRKKICSIGIFVISLFATFIIFELMNWYHFGDTFTKAVLFRFFLFYCFLTLVIMALTVLKNVGQKKMWKIFIVISCIPFVITLLYALNSSINGFSGIYLCTNCYGFKAFIDSIIFIASIFFPTYIMGIILIVISIMKLKKCD